MVQAMGAGRSADVTPPPALILHLYPTHFALGDYDTTYQYNGPLKDFLEAVNRQELPANASDLFKESDFHDGRIYVQVRDYRVNYHANVQLSERSLSKDMLTSPSDTGKSFSGTATPDIRTLVLRPTPASLWADIQSLSATAIPSGPPLAEDTALEAEAKILVATQEPLCLDPDPTVARTANIKAYNDAKYRVPRKRPRNWAAKEEDDEQKRESDRLMLIMDERRKGEFHPKFAKFSFVEDWRKKKAAFDAEALLTIQEKRNIKVPTKKTQDTRFHLNSDAGTIVRTLNFQQTYERIGVTMYTTLNIHSMGGGQYSCTLRWGQTPGTGIGKGNLRGNTLRFPLGNLAAAWWYIQQFKIHYTLSNKLIEDIDSSMQRAAVQPIGVSQAQGVTATIAPQLMNGTTAIHPIQLQQLQHQQQAASQLLHHPHAAALGRGVIRGNVRGKFRGMRGRGAPSK
ncbi:uncharacterized protein SPPG_05258 [Spizellomyces punctatus DAOM BR117]|uniref:Spt20-like SEP domain-containing protein n=1 Tax=Spizellomyces punctatus (strain DAOM BR117) TaxID=645134 RepID=A0A0L0HEJ7_SPIPD|nr:uncharacterized protein SPPG_05258 [Spizellomyces punctatus DAOM BR117]KNC99885.1 hypothetical protein SPPG_05258 [Spizellomyces punctatus DAOM BR117]|eukprot:XP_016607925.1 hypothetical protein SPPG_05258 [Spizellomyces punctatus DAOM BR117]